MTIVALGEITVGDAVPGCASAVVAGTAGINGALPDLTTRIDALALQLTILPSLPPISPAAQLAQAMQLVASLQSLIALGIPAPSISVQIAALSALLADLQVTFTAVNAQLAVLAALEAHLGVAGVGVYAYDGPASSFGSELAAAIGGSGSHCNGLALVAFAPDAWAALSNIMKVS